MRRVYLAVMLWRRSRKGKEASTAAKIYRGGEHSGERSRSRGDINLHAEGVLKKEHGGRAIREIKRMPTAKMYNTRPRRTITC
jgi:hypothetical protein